MTMTNTIIDPDLRDQLLALEHDGWKSLCDGTAAQFYGELMASNALMVLANGAVVTRAEVTSALAGSPPWLRYDIADVRLVAVDDRTAALVYTGYGWREGVDDPFVGAMSSVYHRTDTGWKLALYQQTAVVS
jgi:hypothetical protein